MKIGIEAQRLFRPHKHGMDRVALELVRNLQQIDKSNQYVVFVKSDEDRSVLGESTNFDIVEIPSGSYPIWEQVELPKMARKYGCDLLHCTSNTAPVTGGIPLITTVHDIIYMEESPLTQLLSKATPYQKFGNVYRRIIVPRIINRSKRVITVSEFEKSNIVDRFGKGVSGKLDAVHNGVSNHFKPLEDLNALGDIRKKYGLPTRYLLFFGSKDPRKNTRRVLDAFSEFSRINPAYGLVLMNYKDADLDELLSDLGNPGLRERIVLPGYVDDPDLPGIYQGAELFLFPSLREGFGIPVIEAMACGTPVITSNTSSMPEVAGDAAHLVDPFDVDSIVNGINKILSDEPYRSQLVDKGFNQKDKFSWRLMAEKVLQIYNEVYSKIN